MPFQKLLPKTIQLSFSESIEALTIQLLVFKYSKEFVLPELIVKLRDRLHCRNNIARFSIRM